MKKSEIVRAVAVLGAVAIIVAAALSVGPTYAARGGKHGGGQTGGGTASIKLDQTDPHLGDSVTFTVNAGGFIQVYCNQGIDAGVYFAEQPVGTAFLLGGTSSLWLSLGGNAECSANLFAKAGGTNFLAGTAFLAAGAR
jgi:hypothetical protein